MPEGIQEISDHFIDIESLFEKKNPRLFRIIPKFLFSVLKKIIHQDLINESIYENRDKSGLDFVNAILIKFHISVESVITGDPGQSGILSDQTRLASVADLAQLLDPGSRYIIAANHPLGGPDGLALMNEVGKVRPDMLFPVNDLLTYVPGLSPLFIPINKHGKNTENIAIIDQTFESGKLILYFPAGLVSRKNHNGEIRDLEWKKTFISKAKKHHRDILPVYIKGQNSCFFYSFANFRSRTGIKANLEMLLLPHEMFRHKEKTIRIVFGIPISFHTFDSTRSDTQWAQWIKEKVYDLSKNIAPE